mmetsp:Transcript_2097/g.5549  ORF Transcript_2097/g.5549 Transcript_2097/m.5549 type:complete len:229 (-) Transcript_2097:47-733(-)
MLASSPANRKKEGEQRRWQQQQQQRRTRSPRQGRIPAITTKTTTANGRPCSETCPGTAAGCWNSGGGRGGNPIRGGAVAPRANETTTIASTTVRRRSDPRTIDRDDPSIHPPSSSADGSSFQRRHRNRNPRPPDLGFRSPFRKTRRVFSSVVRLFPFRDDPSERCDRDRFSPLHADPRGAVTALSSIAVASGSRAYQATPSCASVAGWLFGSRGHSKRHPSALISNEA